MIEVHPALRVRKRGAETPRDQVMTDNELLKFWRALDALDEHVARAIKLLLVLGSRLNEIVGIEADQSNVAHGETMPEAGGGGQRAAQPAPPRRH